MPTPSIVRRLVELGEKASSLGKKGLADSLRRAATYDDALSRDELARLITRARRSTRETAVSNALSESEVRRRMDPDIRGRSGTWDPETARRVGSAGGSRVREGAEAPAARRASKEARSAENERRFAALREALKGKSPEEQRALKEAYDAESAASRGGAARSVMAGMGAEGTGETADLKAARRQAMQDINRRLQAGELTEAQANAEYDRVRQAFAGGRATSRRARTENEVTTQTKVGDVEDVGGDYFNPYNTEAKDKPRIVGGRTVMVPGGLDQNVVTAASVARRHIERMVASGEIPGAPPDAAMPNIIRTAMRELGVADSGLDDLALLRAYRQQARRKGAFDRRPAASPVEPVIGMDDVDEVGGAAGAKLLADLRSGEKRQKVEEGFVDFLARELAAGDEVPDEGLTSLELARRVAEAAHGDIPADATFLERESFRRGRGRATRQMRQFERMDEGAGEYAEGAAERRMVREQRGDEVTREPRRAIAQGPQGPRVFVDRVSRVPEKLDETGAVVRPAQFRRGLREVTGREGGEDLGEVGTFRSPFSGLETGGTPRRGVQIRYEQGWDPNATAPVSQNPMMSEAANAADDMERMADELRSLIDGANATGGLMDDRSHGVEYGLEMVVDHLQRLKLRVRDAREKLARELTQDAAAGRARMDAVDDEGNAEVDALVRSLMRRMEGWDPATRDEYFRLGDTGSGLDQQRLVNRMESRGWRERNEALERSLGDEEASVMDTRMPVFPSRMGRPAPRDMNSRSIIAAILDAIGRE